MNMWAQYGGTGYPTEGEGIYTAYSFQKGQSYDIRVLFTAATLNSLSGSTPSGYLNIYAANSLGAANLECGGTPFEQVDNYNATSTLIASIPIVGANTSIDQVFTWVDPSSTGADYSYVWIYPTGQQQSTGSSSPNPYINLTLSSIFICPTPVCPSASVTYNKGTIPASIYEGTVFIGSTDGTGGSGTVTASATGTTTVSAGNLIRVDKNFSYKASGSGKLSLSIQACNSLYNTVASTPDAYDSINIANAAITDSIAQQDSLESLSTLPARFTNALTSISNDSSSSSKLLIYPTVSSGAFTITGSPSDLNNANIIVVDESGRTLASMYNAAGTTIPLDLSNLPNGLYFVQIRQSSKVTTQKIIIIK